MSESELQFESDYSRQVQAKLLEKEFQYVKEQLNDGETLLAVAIRKPLYFTGGSLIFIGLIVAWQMLAYFLMSEPLWTILTVLFSLAAIWVGIRLALFANKEYVFLTNKRVAHQRLNVFFKMEDSPYSIQLTDVVSVRLFKKMSRMSTKARMVGDIAIKKIRGHYQIPTLKDAVTISELLIAELERNRHSK